MNAASYGRELRVSLGQVCPAMVIDGLRDYGLKKRPIGTISQLFQKPIDSPKERTTQVQHQICVVDRADSMSAAGTGPSNGALAGRSMSVRGPTAGRAAGNKDIANRAGIFSLLQSRLSGRYVKQTSQRDKPS